MGGRRAECEIAVCRSWERSWLTGLQITMTLIPDRNNGARNGTGSRSIVQVSQPSITPVRYVKHMCRRCPLCPRGANFSLQQSLRRMNEHRRNGHSEQLITYEQFLTFETVAATQTGVKKSYVEKRASTFKSLENDFRSESIFEATVGLLKTAIYFEREEEACVVEAALFVNSKDKHQKGLWDQIFADVVQLFARADVLCRQAGSTLVRHQLMRNEQNVVSSKVFHPVTASTAKRYARHVSSLAFIVRRYVS